MKFLFYVVGLGLSLFAGLYPSIEKPRPFITKITTIAVIAVVVFLALYPPTVGTFNDAIRAKMANLAVQDVNIQCSPDWSSFDKSSNKVMVNNESNSIPVELTLSDEIVRKTQGKKEIVFRVRNGETHTQFSAVDVVAISPLISLPYIPALEERARIMYFHVPMSWVAFLAYIVTLVYSVLYLRKSNPDYEIKAVVSAGIGTLFCILAYVTGALWAKFNWGKFFNWDTRELSVLVLLLIYSAYFVLRGSIPDLQKRAKLSSVYAIIACISALFLLFILPRITEGLHPGSQDDVNSGPVLSTQENSLNLTKAMIFSLSLSGFTLVYFWLLSIGVRLSFAERLILQHKN